MQRAITDLYRKTYIRFWDGGQQRKIPVLVLGRGGKNQGTHFDHRPAQIKVPQITAFQEFRVNMLVTVMELYIIAGIETVGRPKVQTAAFAADGIANNLP